MPPKCMPLSSKHFDSTQYAKACPQYVSGNPSIWSEQIPQYLQYWGTPNLTAGESAVFATEDCLSLAIWTPANATADSNLPVALFWTGGGFQTNGTHTDGQNPPCVLDNYLPFCSWCRHPGTRTITRQVGVAKPVSHRCDNELSNEHPRIP